MTEQIPDYIKELFSTSTNLSQDLQRTAKWFADRKGKVTGSEVFKVLTKGKGGKPSATRRSYAIKLASERLVSTVGDSFDTPAMQWGREQEEHAVAAFEASTGKKVELVGFLDHPVLPMCGVSLDGMVDNDATAEIKCKNSNNHLEIVLSGECPEEHIPQIQLGLAVTGRKYCYFISYDPRFEQEHLRLFVVKVYRDDEYIVELEAAIVEFEKEVCEIVRNLTKEK